MFVALIVQDASVSIGTKAQTDGICRKYFVAFCFQFQCGRGAVVSRPCVALKLVELSRKSELSWSLLVDLVGGIFSLQ
jgi:hypothetical protein